MQLLVLISLLVIAIHASTAEGSLPFGNTKLVPPLFGGLIGGLNKDKLEKPDEGNTVEKDKLVLSLPLVSEDNIFKPVPLVSEVVGELVAIPERLMSAVGSVIEDITVITAHLLTNTKKVYETSYIEETTLHSCYKAPADLPACIDPAEARFIPQVTTQLPKMDDFSEGTSSKLSPSVEPSFSENKAVDNSAAAQARAIGLFTWVTSTVTLTSVTAVVPHPDQTVTVTWEGCSPSTLPLTLEECTSSDGIDEGMDGTSDENGESGMDGSGDYEIPTSYPSYRTLEEIE